MADQRTPDGVPVLSRGKHRSPRRGACFMEMASFLAGEPWSDHPACTHPLLAQLARMVNDCTSDAERGRLVPHIPSVVGLRGDGLGWEVSVSAAVAGAALPQVSESFQRPLAVGLLRCEEVAQGLEPGAVVGLDELRRAIAGAPHAGGWARWFIGEARPSLKAFREHTAPHLMSCAVRGVAEYAAPDVDSRLRGLLVGAIAVATSYSSRTSLGQPAAARETQTYMTSFSARSAGVRMESRWSTTPSSTPVSQVPQVPS